MRLFVAFILVATLAAWASAADYDLITRGGTIYDGSGEQPYVGDVAIQGETIAAIGAPLEAEGEREIDASGHAVSPGFSNMLSWGAMTMLDDGRAASDVMQGVTLQLFGEGWTLGPTSEKMKNDPAIANSFGVFAGPWNTLAEGLALMEQQGVSPNVASLVGATTIRINVIGMDNREATPEELDAMRELVRQAMLDGAFGLGSSLIYAPAIYAPMDELAAMAEVAAEYDGIYMSHIRSEGITLLESLEEFLGVMRDSGVRGQVYHFKALGEPNWHKLDDAIALIESARREGLPVSANMYTYHFSGTGLTSCFPPWVLDGGHDAMIARLKDPETRAQVLREMQAESDEWENMLRAAACPEGIVPIEFANPDLQQYAGMSIAEISAKRGTPPEETIIDLVVEDNTRVVTLYFSMNEDNIRKKVAIPWMSFGSDARSFTPGTEAYFPKVHPRGYGTFARLLGKYVREEGIIPLEEAIYRLTKMPAQELRVRQRGQLKPGYFADVVVFDPNAVIDRATVEAPTRMAEGVVHVFVNGEAVVKDGEHTNATPGRVLYGPGWDGEPATVK